MKMSESAKEWRKNNRKPTTKRMSENARRQIERVNESGFRGEWTDERRQKISEKLIGNKSRTGLTNSEEQNRKIAESAKYRPVACCAICRREVVVNALSQHLRKHQP